MAVDNPIIKKLSDKWLFDISESDDGSIIINTCQGPKHPWEVCSEIIKFLISLASKSKSIPIKCAVISIPQMYNSIQKNEIIQASKAAGIQNVHLITESSAEILNYWYSEKSKLTQEKTILLYNFTSISLDVSLVILKNNEINIISVDGDLELGGNDFTNNLINYYLEQKDLLDDFKYKYSNENMRRQNKNQFQLIKRECENAVKLLYKHNEVEICPNISLIYDIDLKITNETFEQINKMLINKLLSPVERILENNHISKQNIDDILLTGSYCQIQINKTN